jgi:TusA-related sulfurtransferase
MAIMERSVVGDLINFRGMVYAPLNESGVYLLFGKVAEDLNMYVEEIRPESPDGIVRRFTGKGWERLRVEFEYRSSDFKQRGADADRCDLIICWEHDWAGCPVEVIELRDRIKEMENWPIRRPDEPAGEEGEDLDVWFDEHGVQDRIRGLFQSLADHVKSVDEQCFYRVGKTAISFYSPERTFIHVHPRQSKLRLVLFTGGESLEGVQPMGRKSGGQKWGSVSVSDQDQLLEVLAAVEDSHKRINEAIKRNERTGLQAKTDEVEDESEA